jgi:ABC-type bacteriocin/lantibiotic exporter with double-glycine peptidase domain
MCGGIAVGYLNFGYHADSALALRNLSFSIRPGQFVGIVGASGSGKSTLCRLLIGFEVPRSGTIQYGTRDLEDLDHSALRRRMGIVLQGAVPHGGTILSNISDNGRYSEAAAWEAARLASIDGEIGQMPMGMRTQVGEGGINLSGGQRQRVMIARAICGNPPILILDEATNQLDAAREMQIIRNLAGLACTRIVVAHRLSTICEADWIFVLKDGQIAEQGTYSELMSRGEVFTQLYSQGIARTSVPAIAPLAGGQLQEVE